MKIIFIPTLIISIFFTISIKAVALSPCNNGEAQFGLINSSGYRMYINTTAFDRSILSYTHSNISNTYPTYSKYNFYYNLNKKLSYEISNRDNNLQEIIEINIKPTNNLSIKNVNILSEELPDHQTINHSLMVKKSGIVSSGFIAIRSFSPYLKNGIKLLLHNNLSLKQLNNLLLFEMTKDYLSPNGNKQKDGYRVRNYLTLLPMEWLTIEPTLYFTAFTLYSELDLSLKLETKNKHNSIFVNLSSKEKKFLDHKATLFQVAISERVDFKPWYASIFIQTNHINALYYNGKNKLQLHTIPNLTIEFNHIWEYIDSLDQKIRFKLHYSKKKWFIDTNFTQFLSDKLNSWELSVNLVQIF